MIGVLLFDLDGVLVDADKLHFNALNDALLALDAPIISWSEHVAIYKGLSTSRKLEILSERAGLRPTLCSQIAELKQAITLNMISETIKPDLEKVSMLRELKKRYRIAVCSNAKRKSVHEMLLSSHLLEFCEFYLGNEDVKNPKPAPDIYLKAMEKLGVNAESCLIIEDSDVGRLAAKLTGAVVLPVRDPSEVNFYRLQATLTELSTPRVIIPAAGQGKRFLEAGFLYPKPLIEVEGKPMIEHVLSNFSGVGDPIVILQKNHCELYCADQIINQIRPGTHIVTVDGLTLGAACTVLACEQYLDDSRELIIANSDQFLDFNLQSFIANARAKCADGAILTFYATESKWSYAQVNEEGYVTRVAEKVVISPHATVGVYYFRKGRDFLRAARQMIRKNITVNGEFYVCPIFNELIELGGKVVIDEIPASQMHGLGTPEDLAVFLKRRPETKIVELTEEVTSYEHSSYETVP